MVPQEYYFLSEKNKKTRSQKVYQESEENDF